MIQNKRKLSREKEDNGEVTVSCCKAICGTSTQPLDYKEKTETRQEALYPKAEVQGTVQGRPDHVHLASRPLRPQGWSTVPGMSNRTNSGYKRHTTPRTCRRPARRCCRRRPGAPRRRLGVGRASGPGTRGPGRAGRAGGGAVRCCVARSLARVGAGSEEQEGSGDTDLGSTQN